jgi:large subunit ribosomal protein L28
MPKQCEICGKKATFGNTIARRGRAKYLGGVGIKTTGITRRKFNPNLKKIRVTTADGTARRMVLCTKCLRNGGITKRKARPKVAAATK